MSCNTRERRLNFVVPLGRMDGTNCLFRLTLIALTRELTLEGFRARMRTLNFNPPLAAMMSVSLAWGLDLTRLR